MGRKVLVIIALVGAMLVLPASAAFAHDCFIANRSGQGARGAGHSALATDFERGWVSFEVSEFLAAAEVDDVDAALAEWVAAGYPEALATRVDKVVGESSPNLGNGKGLELFSESSLFGDLVQLIVDHGGDPSVLE